MIYAVNGTAEEISNGYRVKEILVNGLIVRKNIVKVDTELGLIEYLADPYKLGLTEIMFVDPDLLEVIEDHPNERTFKMSYG